MPLTARVLTSFRQVPIMTNSESILQFGNNAYGKPATAMNILRETVMGRELFDHALLEAGAGADVPHALVASGGPDTGSALVWNLARGGASRYAY